MKIISSKFNFDASNIVGLNSELKAMYCYELLKKKNKGFLVVTNSLYEANTLYQYINNYTEKVLLFPMDNFFSTKVSFSYPNSTKLSTNLLKLNVIPAFKSKIPLRNLCLSGRYFKYPIKLVITI